MFTQIFFSCHWLDRQDRDAWSDPRSCLEGQGRFLLDDDRWASPGVAIGARSWASCHSSLLSVDSAEREGQIKLTKSRWTFVTKGKGDGHHGRVIPSMSWPSLDHCPSRRPSIVCCLFEIIWLDFTLLPWSQLPVFFNLEVKYLIFVYFEVKCWTFLFLFYISYFEVKYPRAREWVA